MTLLLRVFLSVAVTITTISFSPHLVNAFVVQPPIASRRATVAKKTTTTTPFDVAGRTALGSSSDDESKHDNDDGKDSLSSLAESFGAFREMSWPYFAESERGKWLFAGMIGMTLLNSGVSVAFSYVSRDFWSALSAKDQEKFAEVLVKFVVALVAGAPVAVFYRFQRERVAVDWRNWMTARVLDLYRSNRVYYNLERNANVEGGIDNPDQRIAEDVRSFTAFSLSFFLTIVTSVIDLVSFSLILYSIQPQLFIAIVSYAAFGTVCTAALGKPLVTLNSDRLRKEADLRYSLVRVRENAESIAFYGGEELEGREIDTRLDGVVDNKKDIIGAQRNLEFFTTSYQYLIQVLPVAVVAPRFFAGEIELGVVSQTAGAFNHILSDLSVLVNQFEQLSAFSAAVDRLATFTEAVREVDPDRDEDDPLMGGVAKHKNITVAEEINDNLASVDEDKIGRASPTISLTEFDVSDSTDNVLLSVRDLSLTTPDGSRRLVRDLDLVCEEGEHLLIVGNSGAGKSSLLRAVAGLWTAGRGSVTRPSDAYFLPQRPYCALGSLRAQLLYPTCPNSEAAGSEYDEARLVDVLSSVGLADLVPRYDGGLDAVVDWSNTLSLGEQQRLAFGRVLLNRPSLVVLDEATSAMDMEAEARMYGLLREATTASGRPTTYVSVGHRPSLLRHHERLLRLRGEEYSVENLDATSAAGRADAVASNL